MYVKPCPEETSYSLLARAHMQLGFSDPSKTLLLLTRKRGYKPLSGLPTGACELVKGLNLPISVEDWIDQHTLFPLYRPFIPEERSRFVREGIKEDGATKSRLGLLRSHCGAREQLAYCQRCADLAISQFGHPYWQRFHLVEGVYVCPKHQLPLLRLWPNDMPWKERALVLPGGGSSSTLNRLQIDHLLVVAEQLADILGDTTGTRVSHELYVDVLRTAAMYTNKGRVRGRRLTAALRRWLKPVADIEPFDRMLAALEVERNWATKAVASDRGFVHPVMHVVIWAAIDCTWRDLVDASRRVGHQLGLPLHSQHAIRPTRKQLETALLEAGTLTGLAAKFGCDVTTAASWCDSLGIERGRRSKVLTPDLRNNIFTAAKAGHTTRDVACRFGVSISTVNRIKRAASV